MSTCFSLETTVAESFAIAPQVYVVFRRLKTDCTGCIFARFCTLGEVAAHYHLDAQDFLFQLNAIQTDVGEEERNP